MLTNCLNYPLCSITTYLYGYQSAAQFESLCGRAVGLEKMVMKAAKSKNRVLLTRPAAEARLLSGQGQGGDRVFKKSENNLFLCLTLPNTISIVLV
jgi:hypothetical protein